MKETKLDRHIHDEEPEKCNRCGEEAEVETIEGWYLCSSCECTYNDILNEPTEEMTMKEFKEEFIK